MVLVSQRVQRQVESTVPEHLLHIVKVNADQGGVDSSVDLVMAWPVQVVSEVLGDSFVLLRDVVEVVGQIDQWEVFGPLPTQK